MSKYIESLLWFVMAVRIAPKCFSKSLSPHPSWSSSQIEGTPTTIRSSKTSANMWGLEVKVECPRVTG